MKKLLIAIALMASAQVSALTLDQFYNSNSDQMAGYSSAVYDMTIINQNLPRDYVSCVDGITPEVYGLLIINNLENDAKEIGWINASAYITLKLNEYCYGNKSPQ